MSLVPRPAWAQAAQRRSDGTSVVIGAQAILVGTHENPAVNGRALSEGYLTQPMVMAEAGFLGDALALKATLNFEGSTMERGELNPGTVGEGYIDRRHPHTYLHELTLTAQHQVGVAGLSLTTGKGFAPFGTDDPMARPFEKYPINHHLAQVLERIVAIGALGTRRIILEAGVFNGDEPQSPGDTPNRSRYWDSWASRLTWAPFHQGELQVSYARVRSPENAAGGGLDQRKQSASIRLEDVQQTGYALAEWARTGDYVASSRTFSFTSLLAETAANYANLTAAVRWERTERPDEQRLVDPFRTQIPSTDLSISGRSRWTILTARLSAPLTFARGRGKFEPFAEVARSRVVQTFSPSGFQPKQFYGSDRIWSVSLGAKIAWGMSHMRMGRYGVANVTRRGMKGSAGKMDHMMMSAAQH